MGILSREIRKIKLIHGATVLSTENSFPENHEADFSVPWSVKDTWAGVIIFVLTLAGMLAVFYLWENLEFLQTFGLVITELLFIAPVVVILVKKKAPWKALGFRKFDINTLAIGCGLLVGTYILVMIHNLLLVFFGATTQGDQVFQLFGDLENPIWLIGVGVVMAPMIEETFFRGFLFSGFRQHFGWQKAALISSGIFSLAHLQLITIIPTFILGYLFAYLFHKSNSIWPGVIFHFLVNSMGFALVFALSQMNL